MSKLVVRPMMSKPSLANLPDELVLRVLSFLDIPELLAISRVSHHLRCVALDPILHSHRLRTSSYNLASFLPHRPRLQALQPPASYIYLTRTTLAARKLCFSLALVSLNRFLARRPPLSSLVNANIVPRDCCRHDRRSGEMLISSGTIVERKRKIEREKVKEGLRVWLERKAGAIGRRKDAGVGILVWRFSKRARTGAQDTSSKQRQSNPGLCEMAESGKVRGLRRFWENVGAPQPIH
ncbi:hypothetical protein AAFC00_006340 [Neodothiora populina]